MGFDNKSGERYGASAVWIFFFAQASAFKANSQAPRYLLVTRVSNYSRRRSVANRRTDAIVGMRGVGAIL